MRIVLLGAPGSGKGTQAALLQETYGIPHVSTGEILRTEVAGSTELGRKAESYMNAGGLVPDDVILDMIGERLRRPDARRGWILDGFPRTLVQARGLQELTDRIGQRVDVGVVLNVDAEVVVQRLTSRLECERCRTVTSVSEAHGNDCAKCGGKLVLRADDQPDIVRRRIAVFEQQTRPVFEFFRTHYHVVDVDASQPLERVTEALRVALERYDHS